MYKNLGFYGKMVQLVKEYKPKYLKETYQLIGGLIIQKLEEEIFNEKQNLEKSKELSNSKGFHKKGSS